MLRLGRDLLQAALRWPNVRSWHLADIPSHLGNVCVRQAVRIWGLKSGEFFGFRCGLRAPPMRPYSSLCY